ncbi:MAG: hypothetical protein U9R02_09620 [Thermodesulfobacteriota bacterium]|nr:hypothetical protein [Thermodesulfobacteriota bacterium]
MNKGIEDNIKIIFNEVCKPFIVPVFLPNVGCPHQCAFCNQTAITGKK